MTLRDEGWEPVTPVDSRDGFNWQLWCDARYPMEADLMGWPIGADFLKTFIEVTDSAGKHASGGIGGVREPNERLRYFTSWNSGFPKFVGVRFAEDLPGVTIETTRRQVEFRASDTESHCGMRFFAMPLDDEEDLVAVSSGDIRRKHVAVNVGSMPPNTADFLPL